MATRRQCSKCPWKKSTDPNDIPNGYCATKHKNLKSTIATPALIPLPGSPLHMMACHETMPGKEKPCVGWLSNQLGPGNNIGLRIAAMMGRVEPFKLVGPQHACLEDTLPKEAR